MVSASVLEPAPRTITNEASAGPTLLCVDGARKTCSHFDDNDAPAEPDASGEGAAIAFGDEGAALACGSTERTGSCLGFDRTGA
tara:strand:- start:47 stop:298 length:252 start_codon:yes stop_codon:yes gene_type:complete